MHRIIKIGNNQVSNNNVTSFVIIWYGFILYTVYPGSEQIAVEEESDITLPRYAIYVQESCKI